MHRGVILCGSGDDGEMGSYRIEGSPLFRQPADNGLLAMKDRRVHNQGTSWQWTNSAHMQNKWWTSPRRRLRQDKKIRPFLSGTIDHTFYLGLFKDARRIRYTGCNMTRCH
jgi:hypothetical protein